MPEIRTTTCQGCGTPFHDDLPERHRCGRCPPERCTNCGEMDSIAQSCRCWTSLEGMPFADVKALFARGAFGLNHNITPEMPDA